MAPLLATVKNSAKRLVYGASQAARIAWYTGHYAYGRRLMGPLTEPGAAPYAEEFGPLDRERLKTSFRALFREDWENIEAGRYKMPSDMYRPPSLSKLWKRSRDYLTDASKVARRKHARGHSEVYTSAQKEKFPRYYLQNFHYQTDGWMTDASAGRYDMQVETLFTGSGDTMRRQVLPMISNALAEKDLAASALLDLGCGTGRFLASVKDNWPTLRVTALDLSPAYLGKARNALGRWPDVSFVEGNAEETGLPSASFDVISVVYLFHELPPAIRKKVVQEITRLLKPGGAVILADTIQYGDEPGFDILLENFPRGLHEPYYDSFCRTDLEALFQEAGLVKTEQQLAFMTKIISFEKKISSLCA